ncbi:50S ribosomal protein L4 [archaeon]|nr:50S ribosomal protein L4 [archaeon]
MKVDVFDLQGQAKEKIDLPKVFSEQIRQDLIRRAVLAVMSNQRQPYGTDPMAGKRTSAHYHGYRRHRWTMMNREMARLPRIHGKASPHLMWRSRFAPQIKGGRQAHPPNVEKIWTLKINKKEKKKALHSAIAACAVKEIVLKRGHKVEDVKELPIVVEDKIQELKKTKDVVNFFVKIGLVKELERLNKRKIRAGRGKMRGRKYKRKVGPLIIVADDKGVSKAVSNLSGVDVATIKSLSTVHLAPGTDAGRLTIWSKSAIEKLGE